MSLSLSNPFSMPQVQRPITSQVGPSDSLRPVRAKALPVVGAGPVTDLTKVFNDLVSDVENTKAVLSTVVHVLHEATLIPEA